MENKIVLKNALLIFIGIAAFFLTMDFVGLAGKNYLRALNAFIVMYGIRKTIKDNYSRDEMDYFENFISGFLTGVLGVFMGIIGLVIFIYIKGGESYLSVLSDTFFFGGKVSIIQYCGVLFFEGVASTLIGTFILMQFYKDKVVLSK